VSIVRWNPKGIRRSTGPLSKMMNRSAKACPEPVEVPLETALQEEVSNHRKLQQLRAVVVSVTEKAEQDFVR